MSTTKRHQPSYMSVAEAAEYLEVSESRVRQFIFDGRIAATKINGKSLWLLLRKDVYYFAALERKAGRPQI